MWRSVRWFVELPRKYGQVFDESLLIARPVE